MDIKDENSLRFLLSLWQGQLKFLVGQADWLEGMLKTGKGMLKDVLKSKIVEVEA